MLFWIGIFNHFIKLRIQIMTNNIEIVNAAVTLIIKAAILAARFSGRTRKRSLKRLSKMDADTKDKELLFLRDKVNQQQMQITILQKGLQKKHTNKRYTLREKLFILCYMETFDIPRRRVYFVKSEVHALLLSCRNHFAKFRPPSSITYYLFKEQSLSI